jgi:hypothetical protein
MRKPTIQSMIREDVISLASMGERQVCLPGHEMARKFIVDRLAELEIPFYKGSSYELPYTANGIELTNIIARIPGKTNKKKPVLIGAHYDTCGPYSGADDNAAAVAIILASINNLRQKSLDRDIIIAIFDAEEPPFFLGENMGSVRFYREQMTESIDCAIIMDLVGHDVPIPFLEDLLFFTGMESHFKLEDTVKQSSAKAKVRIIPTLNKYIGDMSDHHIFRVNNIPYLFLSCGWWEHYHAPTDTPDKLNYKKIAKIRDLLIDLIEKCDSTDFSGSKAGYDTTKTEVEFIKKTIPGFVLKKLGINKLETRADISEVVSLIAGTLQGFFYE